MADASPDVDPTDVTIRVDPEFRKMVDEMIDLAHRIKKERVKLELTLLDVKNQVAELDKIKDEIIEKRRAR